MKIFVIGASGRVGQALVAQLVQAGHDVLAGSRHPQATDQVHVTNVVLDLHASVSELAKQIGQVDAIYFVAGSRGKDLLQTDAFGAVKAMQAAQQNGIQRFIMLSSLFALQPDRWDTPGIADIQDYNVAKFFADHWLVADSKLNYTIIQPGTLTTDAPTGKIAVNVEEGGANPIADVTAVLVAVLQRPNTYHQVILMHSGDLPIETALNEIK
ncbi:NAD-dependent epimerase dehydratase [Lactobacillus selangorensis]|uniref:NAD-dependent epimerase dehydratase n=1 Tax=Lactobacillus selangorensis TaxID=81857 RepID=A0A0R2FMR9_9LACO|nr:NAD(P)-binding oxidoreductase [Lactobacillus selangorensis]KRN29250.1 NAD-dependent epimerase dehydratase [Lactobacillus selangorensis]KRN29792.1 NAD-dependent epimerase dehydratase [Lactobacillus selangorensis]